MFPADRDGEDGAGGPRNSAGGHMPLCSAAHPQHTDVRIHTWMYNPLSLPLSNSLFTDTHKHTHTHAQNGGFQSAISPQKIM